MTPTASDGRTTSPRRFLIATAVSRYQKCPGWDRPGLVQAREQVIRVFTERLGYRHETALGLDPTRQQLTQHLRGFCKSPDRRPDDILALYIAGHGVVLDDDGDHVLLTTDTDPDDVEDALPTAELARKVLRGTQVRRLLLVLDTCYSGQGGNELAAAALERISLQWGQATGAGFVVVSSAQPHQQAETGAFPHLFEQSVGSLATAGHAPEVLAVSAVVQQMNDHPDRPAHQRIGLAQIGMTGEPPPFFANPRHSPRPTHVDLALQHAAEFDAHAERRDTELTTRLLVRAMGHAGDAHQGWWFSGRHNALLDITSWLRSDPDEHRPACLVVTGGPGSGKTAVLGLIAVLTHPERHRTVPLHSLGLAPHLVPGTDTVDVAIYAQNLSNTEVLEGMAAAAEVRADTVGGLLEALGAAPRGRPLTALVDAVDEAATPDTLCSRVLRPLIEHGAGRIRLLLGIRPYLLDRLGPGLRGSVGPGPVVDLDAPLYTDHEALCAYTARNLLEAHRHSPYRDRSDALGPVARAVAAAADPSFLVARITAGTLAAAEHVVADPSDKAWQAALPRLPGEAIRRDLARRLGDEAERATDLLRPLAFAEGQGLPWEDVWAPLASAISGRPYSDEDLLWLRRTAGSYVVEAAEFGRSAYRLYHQALAEHLRDGVEARTVHSAFTDTLMNRVPVRGSGSRDWARAHPYTLSHLAAHGAAAGRLDEVVTQAEFLVHADPDSLPRHLAGARSQPARLAAAVYRASLGMHRNDNATVRRQVLALDAARHGAESLRRKLVAGVPPGSWLPLWATGGGLSPALRHTLTGHRGRVHGVACGVVDGTPVAVTASQDGTARVWDLHAGRESGVPLTGHTDWVTGVACAVLGGVPIAVTTSDDRTARIWDLTTSRTLNLLTGHTDWVGAVACTVVDGCPVAVTGSYDRTVRVWDLTSGRLLNLLTGHTDRVCAVACTVVDGCPVAVTGSYDRTVRVWDLTSGRLLNLLTGHTKRVCAVACATVDGRPVAVTGSHDRTARIWDLTTSRPSRLLTGHTDWVSAVACSTVDGSPVAITTSHDYSTRMWDLESGRLLGRLTGHTGRVSAVTCTTVADEPVAVTTSEDGTVRMWELGATGDIGAPLTGHTDWVMAAGSTAVHGTPVAVTVSDDHTALLWGLDSRHPLGALTGHTRRIRAVACTTVRDVPVALTTSLDATVRIWDLRNREQAGELMGQTAQVRAVACATVAGTPSAVVTTDDRTAMVWDLITHRPVGPLIGETGRVTAVACTTVGGLPVAVTTSDDRAVRVWDLTSRTRTAELTGHAARVRAVACTVVDGTPVAVTTADDRTAMVWDLLTHRSVGRLAGHGDWVTAVACTTVGDMPVAVTTSDDHTVRVWDLRSHRLMDCVSAPGAHVVDCAAEGLFVVGMGSDIAVLIRRTTADVARPAHDPGAELFARHRLTRKAETN